MKLSVNRKEFSDVMNLAMTAINPRHVNPVVQNVMLEASGKKLTVYTTDLDVSLQSAVSEAVVKSDGKVLVPAVRLANVLKDMTSDSVDISSEGEDVVLVSGKSRITMQTGDSKDFPDIPEFNSKNAIKVNAGELDNALSRAVKSIARDPGRYALNGVLMTPGENYIEVCGSDGRSLTYIKLEAKAKKQNFVIILPKHGVDTLIKLCERDPEAELKLDPRENAIVAEQGGVTVSTMLVAGQYPDYWSVIPRKNDKKMVVNRQEFLGAIRLAAHLTSIESQSIALDITSSGISLRTKSSGTGSADVKASVTYKGDSVKMGFDPKYLIEGIAAMQADDVTCEFKDGNTGAIFHEGEKETSFYLVMPMEVD